jgi:hypothetical protein
LAKDIRLAWPEGEEAKGGSERKAALIRDRHVVNVSTTV